MGQAALLDACVLCPVGLRDTVRSAILRSVEGVDPARVHRMLDDMRSAFPEATVRVCERLISQMTNDPADRHVLAAAVAGHADALVTWNVRHFPGSASRPVGVHVVAPDEFLTGLVAAYPKAVVEALGKQSQRYAAPPISVDEILRRRTQTMPRFTAAAGAARVKLERS